MQKKYKIGYTTGVFDLFHIGHLNILKRAKEQCEYLIVGVTSDELCLLRKNKLPIVNQKDRMEIIRSIKYVDKVVSQDNMDKFSAVKEYKCNVVFVPSSDNFLFKRFPIFGFCLNFFKIKVIRFECLYCSHCVVINLIIHFFLGENFVFCSVKIWADEIYIFRQNSL